MEELIFKSDAIKAYNDAMDELVKAQMEEFDLADFSECEFDTTQCKLIARKIEAIPAVEPKQGEWIYCEDDKGQDGYRCSECGFFVLWYYGHENINFIYKYHACPSCMARMKGADE